MVISRLAMKIRFLPFLVLVVHAAIGSPANESMPHSFIAMAKNAIQATPLNGTTASIIIPPPRPPTTSRSVSNASFHDAMIPLPPRTSPPLPATADNPSNDDVHLVWVLELIIVATISVGTLAAIVMWWMSRRGTSTDDDDDDDLDDGKTPPDYVCVASPIKPDEL
ncbi:Aste57867_18551 [Aphanomyces stellatus]|uniref:Aste57867_18551 protein n=1 Tax=Aphanomyces stellatus TaxID=120398 RepID=A0A485LAE4_9STRA|nr:hypothetical protein As57867_018489 [Aphanomyces stellatus]VFT95287.1 Aste57867_18551 [Aphanomyces stellatus]